jgi:hypothetical protein
VTIENRRRNQNERDEVRKGVPEQMDEFCMRRPHKPARRRKREEDDELARDLDVVQQAQLPKQPGECGVV